MPAAARSGPAALFPGHRPPYPGQVIATQVEQPLERLLTQPETKRHRPLGQKVIDPPDHLQLRFLHHVGRVQAGSEPGVEVVLDEGAEFRPVPAQQAFQGLGVAAANRFEQGTGLGRVRFHVWHTSLHHYIHRSPEYVTGNPRLSQGQGDAIPYFSVAPHGSAGYSVIWCRFLRSRRGWQRDGKRRKPAGALIGRNVGMADVVVIATWPFGRTAVKTALPLLQAGKPALDAAIEGAQAVEDDPKVHSVGYGGIADAIGKVTLDACVMDGKTLSCGGVAALENVRHAAAVARRVMEKTPHLLLVGQGAQQFAIQEGFPLQTLNTPESVAEWEKRQEKKKRPNAPEEQAPEDHDTVTVLALDKVGTLGGVCTTSGLC